MNSQEIRDTRTEKRKKRGKNRNEEKAMIKKKEWEYVKQDKERIKEDRTKSINMSELRRRKSERKKKSCK